MSGMLGTKIPFHKCLELTGLVALSLSSALPAPPYFILCIVRHSSVSARTFSQCVRARACVSACALWVVREFSLKDLALRPHGLCIASCEAGVRRTEQALEIGVLCFSGSSCLAVSLI